MEAINKNMKKEMTDFVSNYRRNPDVTAKPTYSTAYTAINGEFLSARVCGAQISGADFELLVFLARFIYVRYFR
jgi:hypothetical protein